jgi:hypothetical protein
MGSDNNRSEKRERRDKERRGKKKKKDENKTKSDFFEVLLKHQILTVCSIGANLLPPNFIESFIN